MLETVLTGLLGASGGAAVAAGVLRLALISEIRAVVERELERERVAMRATYASREDFARLEGKIDVLTARLADLLERVSR